MLNGIRGLFPRRSATSRDPQSPLPPDRSTSPDHMPPGGTVLSPRRAAGTIQDAGKPAGMPTASGSGGTMSLRQPLPQRTPPTSTQDDLAKAGVPEPVAGLLRDMLAAPNPKAGARPRDLPTLVERALQAVCRLLSGPEAQEPAAMQVAARALMAGMQALPDGPERADRATAQLLMAFHDGPRPMTGGELPAYGRRLEAAGLAILTAAPLVPQGERLKGLDVMARFSGTMLDQIPSSAGSSSVEHLKPLLDSAARVRNAVLDSIETLPPGLRGGPLTGLAEQAKYVQFGLHRSDLDAGADNLYPGATVELLASISRLPVEHRHEPLSKLSESLKGSGMFASLEQTRTRLLQAAAELELPAVAAGYADQLRAQMRQLAEDTFLQRNNPRFARAWNIIRRADALRPS